MKQAAEWWAEHRSPDQAARWFRDIVAAIEKIGDHPTHYAKPAEASRFPFEVREMLFGLGRHPSHRVLFTVRPDCIYVFAVRHIAQGTFGSDDLF